MACATSAKTPRTSKPSNTTSITVRSRRSTVISGLPVRPCRWLMLRCSIALPSFHSAACRRPLRPLPGSYYTDIQGHVKYSGTCQGQLPYAHDSLSPPHQYPGPMMWEHTRTFRQAAPASVSVYRPRGCKRQGTDARVGGLSICVGKVCRTTATIFAANYSASDVLPQCRKYLISCKI
jgi:hypothetical protein